MRTTVACLLLTIGLICTPTSYAQSGDSATGDDVLDLLLSSAADTEPAEALAAEGGEEPEVLPTIPVESADSSEGQNETPARPRSRLVEEIVVTAQKREEAIQDVPISIAAFSAEALDARGAFDTKSLPTITPAMSITEFGGYSFVFIRGVGSDAFVPSADPSVTTYVDGIFVPTSQGFSTDFGGVERVEVLKGPQGTLFGRNSTGGAINVITKKPGGEFEGSLQATLANYNERRMKGYVNVPVTESMAFSIDGVFKEYDSQYEHVSRDLIGHSNYEGRVKLHWQPIDTAGLTLSYNYSEQESVGSSISKNIDPSPLFSLVVGGPDEDDYVAETDFEGITVGYAEVISATFEWNLPWFDFKLIGAHQLLHQDYTSYDFDGTSVPLVAFDTYGQFTDATSVEVQILSRPDGWLGESVQWVVGGYYLDGEGGFPNIFLRPAPDIIGFVTDPILARLPEGPLLNTLRNILDPLSRTAEVNLLARGAVGTESLSGFAQGTWYATDWLELTLGGRYTSEKRFLTYADTSAFLRDPGTQHDADHFPSGTTIPLFSYALQESTDTNVSTRAALSVTPWEGQRYYLSYSTGYKSATYNVINIYLPPDYVDPEVVTAYELGMKSDFFGGALRLNAAAFRNEIENKQASFVSLISGGAVALLNAEQATIDGVELDMTLVPFMSWNPGLVFTANGAYLDAKYDKYTDGRGFGEDDGIYREGQDYSGNKIERTPKLSGGAGLSQTLDLGSGELELGVDGYYSSGFFFSAENKDNYKQDAYWLLNGRVSYWYAPWDLRLTVFGNNLLDEDYHIALFETDFGVLSTLAYQARYGLTVGWQF